MDDFLANWLSLYVLSSDLEDGLKPYAFSLTFLSAKGVQFLLAHSSSTPCTLG